MNILLLALAFIIGAAAQPSDPSKPVFDGTQGSESPLIPKPRPDAGRIPPVPLIEDEDESLAGAQLEAGEAELREEDKWLDFDLEGEPVSDPLTGAPLPPDDRRAGPSTE